MSERSHEEESRMLAAMSAEELTAMMDRLVFTDDPVPELPPVMEVMSVRSIRWSDDLDARVRVEAEKRGVSISQFVRDIVEKELVALENDKPVSLADVMRAVASVKPRGDAKKQSDDVDGAA